MILWMDQEALEKMLEGGEDEEESGGADGW